MDILFFLKQRTAFLRQFYENSTAPFEERKQKIEAEEEPYVPPYSEDSEPAFLSEWTVAEESLQIVGYSCICMLSASSHLYLREWEKQFDLNCYPDCSKEFKKKAFKKGLVHGYLACFRERLGILWDESGADLELLEQIVLARNCVQHPASIVNIQVTHTAEDVRKHPTIFFVNEGEMRSFVSLGGVENRWLMPPITITRPQFYKALQEVERFGEWFDAKIRGFDTPGGSNSA